MSRSTRYRILCALVGALIGVGVGLAFDDYVRHTARHEAEKVYEERATRGQ